MRGRTARGNQKMLEQFAVPFQGLKIHQLGAACIRDIGKVQPAVGSAGKIPQQPGVDVAEQQVAGLRLAAGAGHVIQNPLQLERAEVTGHRQSGLGAKSIWSAVADVFRHELIDAGILPDQGVMQRFAAATGPTEPSFHVDW